MWQGVGGLTSLDGIVSPAYTVCIPEPEMTRHFMELLRSPTHITSFWQYSQGLTDDTLNLRYPNFAQIRMKLPTLEEQRAIVAVLDAAERHARLAAQQHDVLARQRAALAEVLLTGERRLRLQPLAQLTAAMPFDPVPTYTEGVDTEERLVRFLTGLPAPLRYEPLPPERLAELRTPAGKDRPDLRTVLLRPVLEAAIRRLNPVVRRGVAHPLTEAGVAEAVAALEGVADVGARLHRADAPRTARARLGHKQVIGTDRKSHTVRYIDWDAPARNAYHVGRQVTVRGPNREVRADLVLYVNGIPFALIKCKRRDAAHALEAAAAQVAAYWTPEAGAPRLFHPLALVVSAQPNGVRYTAPGTPPAFWMVWREDRLHEQASQHLPPGTALTEAEAQVFALLRPERLLAFARRYTLFEHGQRKVARYQQVGAVEATLERGRRRDADGRRPGGVIWHTQGSGRASRWSSSPRPSARPTPTPASSSSPTAWPRRPDRRHVRGTGLKPVPRHHRHPPARAPRRPARRVMTTILDKFDAALRSDATRRPAEASPAAFDARTCSCSWTRPTGGSTAPATPPCAACCPARA